MLQFFLTGVLHELLNFYIDGYCSLVGLIWFLNVSVPFIELLELHLSDLQPSFKGNLKVHDGKEWVDSIFLLDQAVEDVFVAKHS